MSKKFLHKLCVYCNERPSTKTGDHVFAREFFLVSERDNLIKVPACVECNNEKSKIEHYLTTVLPFGGMHGDAKEHLSKIVPPRLEKNQKLKRGLCAGMDYIIRADKNGMHERHLTIPFDGDRYTELFKYAAKALAWHHYSTYLTKETFVYSIALTESKNELFQKNIFSLRCNHPVENTIGNDTVKYKGRQAIDNDQLTIWLFYMFNALTAENSTGKGFNTFNSVGVITGPESFVNKVANQL